MKNFLNILIIIFVAVSIYFMRGDLESAYFKVKNYVVETKDLSSIKTPEDASEITPKNILSDQNSPILKTLNNFLNKNNQSVDLNQKILIDLTNIARSKNGELPNLTENKTLDETALKKVEDMFANQYFEHTSPSGVSVGDLGKANGYEYVLMGENLASGNFKNEQAIVDAWMASPGHRANILNKRYTEIGIAIKYGRFNGDNVWLAVQHFGLPRSSCPEINLDLKTQIESEQKQINSLNETLSALKNEIDGEVASNNEKIIQYNNFLIQYKNLTTKITGEIETYNKQVRSFNDCIAGV